MHESRDVASDLLDEGIHDTFVSIRIGRHRRGSSTPFVGLKRDATRYQYLIDDCVPTEAFFVDRVHNEYSGDKEHTMQATTAIAVDLKLDVVVIPVADVDRATRFSESLEWRLDADCARGEHWRLVQMPPPGAAYTVMFGKGFPGLVQGTFLVVDDLDATRSGNTTGPSGTPRTSSRAYEG